MEGEAEGVPGTARPPLGAGWAWPRGQVVWPGPSPSLSRILALGVPGKIITLAFVPSNSENIHFLTFLEPKTAENRQLALWLLLIG